MSILFIVLDNGGYSIHEKRVVPRDGGRGDDCVGGTLRRLSEIGEAVVPFRLVLEVAVNQYPGYRALALHECPVEAEVCGVGLESVGEVLENRDGGETLATGQRGQAFGFSGLHCAG